MKNIISKLILICIALTFFYCKKNINNSKNENEILKTKVDSVLSLMTVDEKIGQTVQYAIGWDLTGPASTVNEKQKLEKIKNGKVGSLLNVVSVATVREAQELAMQSRLKIPLIFGYDVIHGFKTMFPVPLAETASWDLELIKKSAEISAREAAASGVNWTFAPMVDVSRDARWGRIMEGGGEDPYLNAVVGVARVQGFQGKDLSNEFTIAACAKHFAGYGFAVAGRDYNTVNIGEYELHNIILPPFKAAAKAGVASFMNSFNDLDGIPATGHKILQRDILKGDWNWDGFVVSDWGSIGEMQAHGYAKDLEHAAEIALNAGSDMDMESRAYENHIKKLLKDNRVTMQQLDDAVRRILRVKFQLGLFDDPFKYCDEEREKSEVYTTENQHFAREIAKKSIVLLKNENSILPISKDLKNIAVIGPLANDKDTPLGNWRGQATYNSAVSLLEGIKNRVNKNTKIFYEKGIDLTIPNIEPGSNQFLHPLKFNTTNRSGISKAVAIAKKADVVFLAVGENAYQSGEGRSQTNIGFAGLQDELIEAVCKANKNVVLVLMTGRPMDISKANDLAPSILLTWHLGSQSGNAIADVVFGKYNPSGKLPVSFPRNVGQEPLYYNQKNTGRPTSQNNVTYTSYRDSENTALYPFGFGLSYTNFSYSNINVDKDTIAKNEQLTLSVTIKNEGLVAGTEVVQLYIRDEVASIIRPIKELKGFQKIMLQPKESKTVQFTIDKEMLQFYTINRKWEVEAGDFILFVGSNSETDLKKRVTVR